MEQLFGIPMPEDDDDGDSLVAIGWCHQRTVASGHQKREWSPQAARPFCEVL